MWGWAFLGWGVLSVVLALQLSHASSLELAQSFQCIAANWVVWPFLAPLLHQLTHAIPLRKKNWVRVLPVYFCAAAGAISLATLAQNTLHPAHVGEPPTLGGEYEERRRLFFSLHNVIVLLAIMSGSHAIYFYGLARAQERQSLELEKRLSEARLQMLTMQLQPHFLFNALNSIAALMYENIEQADNMTVALADFLRLTINLPPAQEVPLNEEMEFVRHYLAIELVRFGDRLSFHEQVSPELAAVPVPVLLFQPLVENAFRHGFQKIKGPCRLCLEASRSGTFLKLTLSDNGPGRRPGSKEGTGLGNTRARLKALYGDAATVELNSGVGCVVTLLLPLPCA